MADVTVEATEAHQAGSSVSGKIAVLVAGPFRYAHLVLKNLERFLGGSEFDVFFHIWNEDLGNKVRTDEVWSIDLLQAHPRTKVVIVAEPYSEAYFAPSIGTGTNSNSTINATMGMFFSMSALCSYLIQLPDSRDYRYCLRMRTDCPILSKRFVDKLAFDPNVVTVSKSFHIPEGWISDHITFASRENFFALWHHENIESIYAAYSAGQRNPEKTMGQLAEKRLPGTTIREAIVRNDDYAIIYTPPREGDLLWIRRTVDENGLQALFEDPERFRDEDEIAEAKNRGVRNREALTSRERHQQRSMWKRWPGVLKRRMKALMSKPGNR